MTTPLTLDTIRRDDGGVVVNAEGEIDQSNVDVFNQALTSASAAAAGPFTVDLSAVEYLDSAAINILFAHADHIHLVAHPTLMRILAVSGLTELVTVERAAPA